MTLVDLDREELFEQYSHRVDHTKSVVEISISLMVEETEPHFSEFLQGMTDGVILLLRHLRERFPQATFDYYGVEFDEWLNKVPAMEPYLMSKENKPQFSKFLRTPPPSDFSREKGE